MAFQTRPAVLAIAACMIAPAAQAFDRQTTAALTACHDYLWEVPDFESLPNAAISVWPASIDGNVVKIHWIVDWTDPDVKAAGNCAYTDGEIIGYERQ
ncbi:hypothetical protein ACK8OR_07535 [Jannaschia sp. KMU-145]|uniref:hypothetical protein n=1 Tax=Jannaschia halovivens TaxID=3388667 RepID=UPI00396B3381